MRSTQRVRETTEYDRTVTVCDFCKQVMPANCGYDQDEVTIEGKFGALYPEGDSRDLLYLDCCPKCFTDKLKPHIEALGVGFHTRDVEFGGTKLISRVDIGTPTPDKSA